MAQRSAVVSASLPLKVQFAAVGSAPSFSSTYIRWLLLLPSSAAKYRYHLLLKRWSSGAQISLEYGPDAGGVQMVAGIALARADIFPVGQMAMRLPRVFI